MENYVGIYLGTRYSVICTFDKETQQTRIWKSPEVGDVTPSAIYIDRRGNEFVGQSAYNAAPRSPDNCATLFKRFMGTNTKIELPAVNKTFTPEECSAKILKTLFSYLPEEIRNSDDIGTVITVPAAFNLAQKNATMAAAEMANIGKVELVQEPVAAVMSYMNARGSTDGIYLIYELGEGTLDIAIAESIRKRVVILAHGGIQMCGGRDFDRKIVDNIVRPWLHENFDLPNDLVKNPAFKPLIRLATWATERAKIELSAKDESIISLSEVEIGTNDLNGEEVYLDIPLNRNTYDELIADQIDDTIDAARETLSKTGYTPNDIECIVWIGDATHYKPLRDKVSFELGIKGNTFDVNPMTAVAEGASICAESIYCRVDNQIKIRTVDSQIRIETKVRELIQRRNRVFLRNSGMDLLHNPFYCLKATQHDNKQKIIELAEEKSLFSDTDKYRNMQETLTHPRRRISAEVAWLPGISVEVAWLPGIPPDRVYDILLLFESSIGNHIDSDNSTSISSTNSLAVVLSRLPYANSHTVADSILELLKPYEKNYGENDNLTEVSKFLGFDKLSPIARANLIAARMLRLPEYTAELVVSWILAISKIYDEIKPTEVCYILNEERKESGFPEITDISTVATEIQKLRHYYKQVIKFALENIHPIKECVNAVTMLFEATTKNNLSHIPILIEDAIDAYETVVESSLAKKETHLERQDQNLRIAAEKEEQDIIFSRMIGKLNQTVIDWGIIAQPIIINKKRQGLEHTACQKVSERVRLLTIFLYNEYDKLKSSQQILKTLKEVFAEFPEIDERITADLETLNKIAKQRENNDQVSLFDQ